MRDDDHFRRRAHRPAPRARPPDAPAEPQPDPPDRLMRGLVTATLVCAVSAAILFAIQGPVLVTAIAIVLAGVALVLLVSTGFYAIGRSEDRERERTARERE